MAFFPFTNGQKPMSSSIGVVIASDQTAVSVSGTVAVTGIQGASVSGTVGASVIGHAPVVIVGGSILTSSTANQSVSGTVQAQLLSTNASVITVGSPVANQSVSGTVGASVIGTVPVTQATTPWTIGSVYGNFSGSVAAFQTGTWRTSVISSTPTSMLVGASIFGQLPAGTAPLGSVATLQGTNPWVSLTVGSVIAVVQANSIAGTYAEDAAHTSADRGLFVLGVRNDTVASFTSANGEYNAFAHDSAGRVLNKPFAAGEASVIANTSIVSAGTTASVLLFAAGGAGIKNYITDWALSNSGGTTVVALIADSDSSVIGRPIVPSGGGNNANFQTPLVTTRANVAVNLQLIGSSSIVYATVTGYRAP